MDICVTGSVKHPWEAASQLAPRLFDANPKTLKKSKRLLAVLKLIWLWNKCFVLGQSYLGSTRNNRAIYTRKNKARLK